LVEFFDLARPHPAAPSLIAQNPYCGMQMEMAFGKQIHLAANWRQISQVLTPHDRRESHFFYTLSLTLKHSLCLFHSLSLSLLLLAGGPSSAATSAFWSSQGKAHHVRHHLVT